MNKQRIEQRLRDYLEERAAEPAPIAMEQRIIRRSLEGGRSVLKGRPSPTQLLATAAVIVFGLGLGIAVLLARSQALVPPGVGGRGPSATASPKPSTSAGLKKMPSGAAVVPGGLLAPGSYEYFDVDGAGFNFGFTVPAGWTWNGWALISTGGYAPPDGAAISFWGGRVQVYTDPCHWAVAQPNPPTGPSVDDLMAALAAQPMRGATIPIDRPANALGLANRWAGRAIDLTVPANLDFATCDGGQFRSWGPEQYARYQQGPAQHDRVWAVDLTGNGVKVGNQRLIIDTASFPGTPLTVISEMNAILASIYAGHWG